VLRIACDVFDAICDLAIGKHREETDTPPTTPADR
jgi:hypothetical protein